MFDPISYAIDKVEDLMGHSPHPAIVTVPIGAFTVSNVCDGLAAATGEGSYDDAARISMAIGLVGTAAAALTGLRDYSRIPKDRGDDAHSIATQHGLGNGIVAALMVGSYILRSRDHAHDRPAGVASRVLGLTGGALTLYTAWLGGKLISEYGESVKHNASQLEW